jgi:hypothetical protein
VARSSSCYERELKEILQSDPERLRAYRTALPPGLREELPARLDRSPFLVVRAAGSLGFDLVALRREFAFPLEVKTSRSATIHFSAASGRAAEQLELHRASAHRAGLLVLYAYRRIGLRSGDPWRLYTPAAPPGKGRVELIRKKVPVIETTRGGHAVMRWEAGKPLSEFLDLVTSLVDVGA